MKGGIRCASADLPNRFHKTRGYRPDAGALTNRVSLAIRLLPRPRQSKHDYAHMISVATLTSRKMPVARGRAGSVRHDGEKANRQPFGAVSLYPRCHASELVRPEKAAAAPKPKDLQSALNAARKSGAQVTGSKPHFRASRRCGPPPKAPARATAKDTRHGR